MTFCRFVTIKILLHAYFEYFLDILILHIFSNKHCWNAMGTFYYTTV